MNLVKSNFLLIFIYFIFHIISVFNKEDCFAVFSISWFSPPIKTLVFKQILQEGGS